MAATGGATTTATTTATMSTSTLTMPSGGVEQQQIEFADAAALDALATALTTDHGAVDVCRRAAGFLLARLPGSVAVQITMHGATSDAPPQVFTFPRRPTAASAVDDGTSKDIDGEASTDDEATTMTTTAAAAAATSSSSILTADQQQNQQQHQSTSLDAVCGSHAGSGAAVSWSVADAEGPSSSSSVPAPPYSDWRALARSHDATAFLTVPASLPGRPRASLTIAGNACAAPPAATEEAAAATAVAAAAATTTTSKSSLSSSSPSFPVPPSPSAAPAARAASSVAALLAPYLALAAVRGQLDAAQALLADVMPHGVMAGVVERHALGLAPAMLGGTGPTTTTTTTTTSSNHRPPANNSSGSGGVVSGGGGGGGGAS